MKKNININIQINEMEKEIEIIQNALLKLNQMVEKLQEKDKKRDYLDLSTIIVNGTYKEVK